MMFAILPIAKQPTSDRQMSNLNDPLGFTFILSITTRVIHETSKDDAAVHRPLPMKKRVSYTLLCLPETNHMKLILLSWLLRQFLTLLPEAATPNETAVVIPFPFLTRFPQQTYHPTLLRHGEYRTGRLCFCPRRGWTRLGCSRKK